ncbi:female-specific histamine-binding protein 2-like [Rhipicephalus microplus]|uniref:female-specific histamine-binding protein 2-like n=1 Tax=Rhipicephalus microplus TaxID=6941 RepID=UPI003F6CFDD4
MVSATYMDDSVFGQNFTCLILAADDFNEENKGIEGYFMYLNNDGADGHYETVTAVKMYGYNKENALNYKTQDEREYTDIVAFSDEGCYVTYIPGTDGRTEGYEL